LETDAIRGNMLIELPPAELVAMALLVITLLLTLSS
jgi:hypothetical protein